MPKAKYDEAENKIETIELERLESKATRVWLLLPALPDCNKNGGNCQKCKVVSESNRAPPPVPSMASRLGFPWPKLFFSFKQLMSEWGYGLLVVCVDCIHRMKHCTLHIIVSISVVDNLPHWYLVKIARRRPESNNSYKVQIQNTEEVPGAKICLCQWHF